MPVENEPSNNPSNTPEANPAPASAPTLNFTPDQLSEAFSKGLERAAQRAAENIQPLPQQPQRIEKPTFQDIGKAYEDGDFTRAIRLQEQRETANRQELEETVINPLRQTGATAISSLAMDSVANDPYYKEYKTEVDNALKQVNGIITPQIARNVLNYVKGQHSDEIIAREREIAVRTTRESMPASEPNGGRGVPNRINPALPPADELFGTKAVNQMREKGKAVKGGYQRDPEDEEAYRQGYQGGYAEMVDHTQRMAKIQTDNPSFGLDMRWDKVNKQWVKPWVRGSASDEIFEG